MSALMMCDGCQKVVPNPRYRPEDWLAVEADEDADNGHLCSWTCLAAWAMQRAMQREGVVPGGEE